METQLDQARQKILELEDRIKKLTSDTVCCPLVEIDTNMLQMCIDMYKSGDKLTAIKWLIEEAKHDKYKFGIKWAQEYFENLKL